MKTRLLLLLLTLSLIFTASCNQGDTPTTDTSGTTTAQKNYTLDEINKLFDKETQPGADYLLVFRTEELSLYNALLQYNKFENITPFVTYEKIQSLGDFLEFYYYYDATQYFYYLKCSCGKDSHDERNWIVYVYTHSPSPPQDCETEKSNPNLLVWEPQTDMQDRFEIYYQLTPNVYFRYQQGQLNSVSLYFDQMYITFAPQELYEIAACPTHSKYFNESTAADAWNGLYHAIFELRDE